MWGAGSFLKNWESGLYFREAHNMNGRVLGVYVIIAASIVMKILNYITAN